MYSIYSDEHVQNIETVWYTSKKQLLLLLPTTERILNFTATTLPHPFIDCPTVTTECVDKQSTLLGVITLYHAEPAMGCAKPRAGLHWPACMTHFSRIQVQMAYILYFISMLYFLSSLTITNCTFECNMYIWYFKRNNYEIICPECDPSSHSSLVKLDMQKSRTILSEGDSEPSP